jgi:hypothetical protein
MYSSIQQINGRAVSIQVKKTPANLEEIDENRARILAKAYRNNIRNVGRELKQIGLVRDVSNQFAGWQGRSYRNHEAIQHIRPLTKSTNEKFQDFLATQSLPEQF